MAEKTVTIDTDSDYYRYLFRKLSGGVNPEDLEDL